MHMSQLQILKLKDWYITTKYDRLDHNDYIRLKHNTAVHTIALDLLINRLYW